MGVFHVIFSWYLSPTNHAPGGGKMRDPGNEVGCLREFQEGKMEYFSMRSPLTIPGFLEPKNAEIPG